MIKLLTTAEERATESDVLANDTLTFRCNLARDVNTLIAALEKRTDALIASYRAHAATILAGRTHTPGPDGKCPVCDNINVRGADLLKAEADSLERLKGTNR